MEFFWINLQPLGIVWLKSWFYLLNLVGFTIPIIQLLYNRWKEKEIFRYHFTPLVPLILKNCLYGIIFGILLSIILSTHLFSISLNELIWIWMITILLGTCRFRFVCLSYSVGFVAIIHLILNDLGVNSFHDHWGELATFFLQFSIYDWLWLVTFLHFSKWLLIRIDGANGCIPVCMDHPSSKWKVNGYILSKSWYIPMTIWTTSGWLPLPVILSFSTLNTSLPLKQQKRLMSTFILGYSMLLCIGMVLSTIWPFFLWFTAMLSLGGNEVIYQWMKWKEKRNAPIYVSDEKGLKIFAILPRSPADKMKMKIGDIIQRVNGFPVRTNEQLEAIMKGATVCKFEMLDEQENRHVIQKVLYDDDPENLGIIGATSLSNENEKPYMENSM